MSRYPSLDRRILGIVVLILSAPAPAGAQKFEDVSLIDSPTAGIIPHGSYMLEGSVGPDNGLLFGVKVGFYDRLIVGASFGLQEFIGRGEITFNDRPGFQVRFRIIEESVPSPALAIGVDTQGEEAYDGDQNRYERKSKGFYAVLSKNYRLYRNLAFHGGVNYSLENHDEKGVDLFAGLSVELFEGMMILLDYAPALNDNDTELESCRTRGKGYLDAGVRFDYRESLRIRILFRDLTGNYERENGVARSLEILFIDYF